MGEELNRLPAKYRCPVELCHLQGMTYDQAARQLNWSVATVKSRLTKGRLRLRSGWRGEASRRAQSGCSRHLLVKPEQPSLTKSFNRRSERQCRAAPACPRRPSRI